MNCFECIHLNGEWTCLSRCTENILGKDTVYFLFPGDRAKPCLILILGMFSSSFRTMMSSQYLLCARYGRGLAYTVFNREVEAPFIWVFRPSLTSKYSAVLDFVSSIEPFVQSQHGSFVCRGSTFYKKAIIFQAYHHLDSKPYFAKCFSNIYIFTYPINGDGGEG